MQLSVTTKVIRTSYHKLSYDKVARDYTLFLHFVVKGGFVRY